MGYYWIKLHKALLINERFTQLSLAAQAAYIALLLRADEVGGVFESERQIRVSLGPRYYKYVPKLRQVGLINGLKVYNFRKKQGINEAGFPQPGDAEEAASSEYKTAPSINSFPQRASRAHAHAPEEERREEEIRLKEKENKEREDLDGPAVEVISQNALDRAKMSRREQARRIFEHYREGTGRKKAWCSEKNLRMIEVRLKEGYDPERLIAACYGWRYDDWEGRINNIHLADILRPRNIENFADWQERGGKLKAPSVIDRWYAAKKQQELQSSKSLALTSPEEEDDEF